ncbi:MAG TPA: hypothetical protein DCL21_00725 [Alphaproteobacteria bacterium]|nr:hypothetical protein [Alphaproteobacteria bacterium]
MKASQKLKKIVQKPDMIYLILLSGKREPFQKDGTYLTVPTFINLPREDRDLYKIIRNDRKIIIEDISPEKLNRAVNQENHIRFSIEKMKEKLKELGFHFSLDDKAPLEDQMDHLIKQLKQVTS